MTAMSTKLVTADDLFEMGDIGRCELIYGEIVMMSPAGFDHATIANRLGHFLTVFVTENDLGEVAAETGYKVESEPDLVRAPDVSFVRKSRLARGHTKKYFVGVPDLAIEVVSPTDKKREIAEKVNMWLVHGTLSCWVVDPATMTITVHRAVQKPIRLTLKDRLTNDPALPGFALEISKVFKRP